MEKERAAILEGVHAKASGRRERLSKGFKDVTTCDLQQFGESTPQAKEIARLKGRGGSVPAGPRISTEVSVTEARGTKRNKEEEEVDTEVREVRRGPIRPRQGLWCLLNEVGAMGGFRVEEGRDLTQALGGRLWLSLRTGKLAKRLLLPSRWG